MGRAIVRQPQVFCMDEPLSNLDAKMRVQTRTDIAKLQADLGVTTVYVTHDQVEAMTMGDRVAVMKDGYLQQVDTPLGLYDKPVNLFVAGFIGSPAMNLLEATADGRQGQDRRLPRPGRPGGLARRWRATSPSAYAPRRGAIVGNSEDGLPVRVTVVEDLGSDAFVYGTSGVEGTPNNIIIRVNGRDHVQKGETIYVTTDPQNVHVFDTDVRRAPLRVAPSRRQFTRVGAGSSTGSKLAPTRRFQARSAVRRMAATKVSNSSGGRSWPMPSMSSSSAPGIGGGGGAAAGDVHHLVGEAVDDQGRARVRRAAGCRGWAG